MEVVVCGWLQWRSVPCVFGGWWSAWGETVLEPGVFWEAEEGHLLSAADICVPRAGEHGHTPVRRVHGRHSAGSSRVGTKPNTLMDMRTDVNAVPHAGLGFHFLRKPEGTIESWRS